MAKVLWQRGWKWRALLVAPALLLLAVLGVVASLSGGSGDSPAAALPSASANTTSVLGCAIADMGGGVTQADVPCTQREALAHYCDIPLSDIPEAGTFGGSAASNATVFDTPEGVLVVRVLNSGDPATSAVYLECVSGQVALTTAQWQALMQPGTSLPDLTPDVPPDVTATSPPSETSSGCPDATVCPSMVAALRHVSTSDGDCQIQMAAQMVIDSLYLAIVNGDTTVSASDASTLAGIGQQFARLAKFVSAPWAHDSTEAFAVYFQRLAADLRKGVDPVKRGDTKDNQPANDGSCHQGA